MVAERGRLVPVPSVMERGSPGGLNFGGRGLCDSETADLASARECPPTPGMIQPAGNPEKESQDMILEKSRRFVVKWSSGDKRVRHPPCPPGRR